MRNPCLNLTALLVATAASSAHAISFVPTASNSWERSTGSYHAWDSFQDDNLADNNVGGNGLNPITDLAPDVNDPQVIGRSAIVNETTGGAFVTNSGFGNIYSQFVATAFEVSIPEYEVGPSIFAPPHNTTVIVQMRTLGSELDYDSVKVNGLDPVDMSILDRTIVSSPFGASSEVEVAFVFNVLYNQFADDNPGTPESLQLTFNAGSSSVSLDQLSVDTTISPAGFTSVSLPTSVPEPSSLALLGAGGLMLLRRRRSA